MDSCYADYLRQKRYLQEVIGRDKLDSIEKEVSQVVAKHNLADTPKLLKSVLAYVFNTNLLNQQYQYFQHTGQ